MHKYPKSLLVTALLALAAPALAASPETDAARARIDSLLDRNYPPLDALYKDIHAHAEIAFQEKRTAKILATEMRKIGFAVTENVGGTGVVALYRNGAGPTILVRTDMDGLPLEEKTGLPYASKNQQILNGEPVSTTHACGHDIHMSWWLGTAQALVAMKDQWSSTLLFVGQPAEETVSGARAMIDAGLFKDFPKPDYGFAAHVTPEAIGSVRIKDGTASSAQDAVNIVFKGRGAHGSLPSHAIDPIVMGAHFISDVQTVISRQKDAGAFGVITVGSFHAGTVANIIPDTAELQLTLRSYSPEVRTLLLEGVERTARAIAQMAAAPAPEIKHLYGTAAVRNDSSLAERASTVLKQALGDGIQFIPAYMPPSPASEDFSDFVDAGIPSLYYLIGGNDPKVIADYKARGMPLPINHSPYFAPSPEPSIRRGVQVLTLSVLMVAGKSAAPVTRP